MCDKVRGAQPGEGLALSRPGWEVDVALLSSPTVREVLQEALHLQDAPADAHPGHRQPQVGGWWQLAECPPRACVLLPLAGDRRSLLPW